MGLIESGQNVTFQVCVFFGVREKRGRGHRKIVEKKCNKKRLLSKCKKPGRGGVQPGLSRGLYGDCSVCLSELLNSLREDDVELAANAVASRSAGFCGRWCR